MSGAIPLLPQYAFMAWCSVKAQGQLYLYLLYQSFMFFTLQEVLWGVTAFKEEFKDEITTEDEKVDLDR
jgi:hypothetical protein